MTRILYRDGIPYEVEEHRVTKLLKRGFTENPPAKQQPAIQPQENQELEE